MGGATITTHIKCMRDVEISNGSKFKSDIVNDIDKNDCLFQDPTTSVKPHAQQVFRLLKANGHSKATASSSVPQKSAKMSWKLASETSSSRRRRHKNTHSRLKTTTTTVKQSIIKPRPTASTTPTTCDIQDSRPPTCHCPKPAFAPDF